MTFISKLASKTGASIVIGYAERLPKGKGYHLTESIGYRKIDHFS